MPYSVDPASMHEWFNSIPNAPVSTWCDLVRLSDLGSIKLFFPRTAANLDLAITSYIQGSILQDWPRTQAFFPWYMDQWVGDANCQPCYSQCYNQPACPGQTECYVPTAPVYGEPGCICHSGWSSDKCVNSFLSTGNCANVYPSSSSHMCATNHFYAGAISMNCNLDGFCDLPARPPQSCPTNCGDKNPIC